MAQQQQNLHLFKTMLQQKEVYVMDLEDEVNNLIVFIPLEDWRSNVYNHYSTFPCS